MMFDGGRDSARLTEKASRHVLVRVRRRLNDTLHLQWRRTSAVVPFRLPENTPGVPVESDYEQTYKYINHTGPCTSREVRNMVPWHTPHDSTVNVKDYRSARKQTSTASSQFTFPSKPDVSRKGTKVGRGRAAGSKDVHKHAPRNGHGHGMFSKRLGSKTKKQDTLNERRGTPNILSEPKPRKSKRKEEYGHKKGKKSSEFDLIESNPIRHEDRPEAPVSQGSELLAYKTILPVTARTRSGSRFRVQQVSSSRFSQSSDGSQSTSQKELGRRKHSRLSLEGASKKVLGKELTILKRDKWSIACLRATSQNTNPPDETHIQTIFAGLRGGGDLADPKSAPSIILSRLRAALQTGNWCVMLKTQIVFHSIFRCGNQRFVDYMSRALREPFEDKKCTDRSAGGLLHAPFVQAYGEYLHAWLVMRCETKFPPDRTSDCSGLKRFQKSPPRDLVLYLPVIARTFSKLLEACSLSDASDSLLAQPAVMRMLRDVKMFCQCLAYGLKRLRDLFKSMASREQVHALVFYKEYRKCMARARFVLQNLQGQKHGVTMDIECCPILSQAIKAAAL